MQAIRQCSVCARHAAGGLVRNQTDVSLLQTSRTVRSEGRKPGVQTLGRLTSRMSIASLSVDSGVCDQVENLSHDSLIRRAASVVTDSSSTFLSQATLALIDALTDYSKAVHSRIAFQRRYLVSLGKLSPAEQDSLQQVISGWRAEAIERLEECKRYEMCVYICVSPGAQQASISVRTNIQVAQSQVDEARKLSADADKKLAETKVEEIQRMAEYTAFLEGSEEHEVHEAYLRED
uniref:Direct IAP-binding protein with low pI n=1 Tax=Acanthochromis polyacanthus TaxID=80966 RepID=A0A3Q1FFE9_9TELE